MKNITAALARMYAKTEPPFRSPLPPGMFGGSGRGSGPAGAFVLLCAGGSSRNGGGSMLRR